MHDLAIKGLLGLDSSISLAVQNSYQLYLDVLRPEFNFILCNICASPEKILEPARQGGQPRVKDYQHCPVYQTGSNHSTTILGFRPGAAWGAPGQVTCRPGRAQVHMPTMPSAPGKPKPTPRQHYDYTRTMHAALPVFDPHRLWWPRTDYARGSARSVRSSPRCV